MKIDIAINLKVQFSQNFFDTKRVVIVDFFNKSKLTNKNLIPHCLDWYLYVSTSHTMRGLLTMACPIMHPIREPVK